MKDIRYTIADNIKYYRKQVCMSQMKLAEGADMSYDTIKRIESGNRGMSMDSFMNIAKALNVEPFFLLCGDDRDSILQIEKLYILLRERSKAEQDYLLFMMEKLVEGLSLSSN